MRVVITYNNIRNFYTNINVFILLKETPFHIIIIFNLTLQLGKANVILSHIVLIKSSLLIFYSLNNVFY